MIIMIVQVVSFRDPTEEDPREVEADKVGLNYIGLDGNIACLGKQRLGLGPGSKVVGL